MYKLPLKLLFQSPSHVKNLGAGAEKAKSLEITQFVLRRPKGFFFRFDQENLKRLS